MEWIKVKVQHAEYQMSAAPDNVFKAWIMVMAFVAATECKPLQKVLCKRYGENNIKDLEKWCLESGISLDLIIDKILEDVNSIKDRKAHDRKYMKKYRSKTLHNPNVNTNVMGKRREEKIREEKIAPTDFIPSLKANPAYQHINVDMELAKMDAWLSANKGRQKTKRFIVNWLNKIEKPIGSLQTTRRVPV
jgi:hypothetical protein